jgi:hypothetical protein
LDLPIKMRGKISVILSAIEFAATEKLVSAARKC